MVAECASSEGRKKPMRCFVVAKGWFWEEEGERGGGASSRSIESSVELDEKELKEAPSFERYRIA
jgi:hypothetical protein